MENLNQKTIVKKNVINIYNREKIDLTGVKEVLSSTDKQVIVKVEDSIIFIQGRELRVVKLIPEDEFLSISGFVDALKYDKKINKKSFMTKVFK